MRSLVCNCTLPLLDPTACARCMPELLQDNYIVHDDMPKGWLCMKCGSILSPYQAYCPCTQTMYEED